MSPIKRIASSASNIIKSPLRLVKGNSKSVAKRNSKDSKSLIESLKSPEIRKKLLFTAAMVLVYRILSAVPLPGIDIELFNQAFGNNPLNNIFTIVTGGRLDSPSLVAIGLGAYINASIIIQLLQTIIPKLEELSKEGERGKKVLNQYTRILAVPLSVVQAFVIYTILRSVGSAAPELAGLLAGISTADIITMVAALTAGSILLMWIGELITEYGIGNGSSIIIAASILSVLPNLVTRDFGFVANDSALLAQGNFNVLLNENFRLVIGVVIGMYILVWGIVYVTESVRKVTIQYASRVRGQGGQASYLPLKITQAGVVPVIFASAMLTFPQIISQLLVSSADKESVLYKIGERIQNSFLGQTGTVMSIEQEVAYFSVFFVLIVLFSYFYTFITYKPAETADNLKKSAGFIPGIRPGKNTELYITKVMIKLTFVGSIFLGIIALIPNLVRLSPQGQNLTIFSGIGGTSLLIIVGVFLDTMRQMRSLSVTKSYDQYK